MGPPDRSTPSNTHHDTQDLRSLCRDGQLLVGLFYIRRSQAIHVLRNTSVRLGTVSVHFHVCLGHMLVVVCLVVGVVGEGFGLGRADPVGDQLDEESHAARSRRGDA